MSENHEKEEVRSNTAACFRPVALPFTAAECIGLSSSDILKLYVKYNTPAPKNKVKDVTVEIRLSEATLICRIQNDVCTEAYLYTDDTDNTDN